MIDSLNLEYVTLNSKEGMMQSHSDSDKVLNKNHNIPTENHFNISAKDPLMDPLNVYRPFYPGVGKFKDQVVIITGGESELGRAIALAFANEGALLSLIYKDAIREVEETKRMVETFGTTCLLLEGDVGDKNFCTLAVDTTMESFGRIDVLINNSAAQIEQDFSQITEEGLINTFRTNTFSYFYMTQAVLPYLQEKTGSILMNTTANAHIKGVIFSLTRSLATYLLDKGIRVNAVAPGPIADVYVSNAGKNTPTKQSGHPNEVAGAFTWLASKEASYMTGQVLHLYGGI